MSSDGDQNADLIASVAAGDGEAVRLIVDRHLGRVMALARRMLHDAQEAEDVAQEVFLRVWKHAHRWEPGRAKFETWLHRVTVNLCYDRLRKRREVLSDALPELADPAPAADAMLHRDHMQMRVGSVLRDLPERQRLALTLCHFQGMSNADAADVMEVSVDAMESLLARGRRGLKAALRGEAAELLGDME